MKSIKRFFRLAHIGFVLMRFNLDEIIFAVPVFYPFRFLCFFNPWYWKKSHKKSRAERMRLALEALGPIFIKAGQILSTRRDLLPEDIAAELEKLQDRVPPFVGDIRKIIEKALGAPLENFFREVDFNTLASASIAQVHAATLLNGREVVIKILRPGVEKLIERDLDLLSTLAELSARYSSHLNQFKPKEMIAEIAHTLHDELDLQREGANASELRRHFKHSDLLYVPEVEWSLSRNPILVMERIYGIPVYDVEKLREAGFNMKHLAERGIELFFTQVFRDSFFHADMHPGNIFVSTENKDNPKFIVVDFGIMGSLNAHDQRYIAENLLAFFKRDYRRVAELHVASGWLPPNTRVDHFESAIRAVCEPIFERPLRDISFGQLLLRLFQAARRYHMNIQPQLILLQKTLLNIEGVGRQLYPDLDLWTTATPILERWLKSQMGIKSFLRKLKDNLPYWAEKFPEIPTLIYGLLNQLKPERK